MASRPQPAPPPAPVGTTRPRLDVGRHVAAVMRQVSRHKLAVVLGGVGLVLLMSVALGVVLIQGKAVVEDAIPKLAQVYDRLDAGDDIMATELAQRLRHKYGVTDDEVTGVAYALGVARARLADRDFGDDQRRGYLVAARYLATVHERGWPEGREAEGLWTLGRALFASRKWSEARGVLEEALPLVPNQTTTIHHMLARIWLSGEPPQWDRALAHLDQYLADDELAPLDRQIGEIERAEALFLLGEFARATTMLDAIPEDSPLMAAVHYWRARLLLEEARALARDPLQLQDPRQTARLGSLYEEALQRLRSAQDRDTLQTQLSSRAMYLLAVVQRERGNRQAALEQFARTVKLHYESPEGLAASLAEAALLFESDRDQEGVEVYRGAFERLDPEVRFHNPWLTAEELSGQLRNGHRHLVERGEFALADQLLEAAQAVLSPTEIAATRAETYERWAQRLAAQAAEQGDDPELADQAADRFRQAGLARLKLADLERSTREYPELLWLSSESLLAGKDFAEAARVLEEYLAIEYRGHRPAALVSLGRAYLALERVDEALKVLEECIERHPRDAANFLARVLAAEARQDRGETDVAEQLLLENLEGDSLSPASPEWRSSLFLLGRLLFQGERYAESAKRLEEAVARYPDDPRSLESHYLIAESYRHLAQPPETLDQEVAESTRLAQAKQAEQYLLRALPHYLQAQEAMDARREKLELSSRESALLRNVHFARGEVLFDLRRYAEAVDAFSTAVNRQPNSPEVLEAFVQIAECYRRLNRPDEARATIEQAKVLLRRLGATAPFKETTNYTAEGWIQRLEWLGRL